MTRCLRTWWSTPGVCVHVCIVFVYAHVWACMHVHVRAVCVCCLLRTTVCMRMDVSLHIPLLISVNLCCVHENGHEHAHLPPHLSQYVPTPSPVEAICTSTLRQKKPVRLACHRSLCPCSLYPLIFVSVYVCPSMQVRRAQPPIRVCAMAAKSADQGEVYPHERA